MNNENETTESAPSKTQIALTVVSAAVVGYTAVVTTVTTYRAIRNFRQERQLKKLDTTSMTETPVVD